MNSDEKMMARAIRLAKKGAGWVSPNPLVGAILVKKGKIIGEGFHEQFGENHAEKNAILDAEKKGFSAEGATIFVTLEPCAHWGKTPPCADLLVEKKIARVVIGALEKNPLSHGGMAKLKSAGIETQSGILEEECRAQNRFFFHGIEKKRPFFLGKMAVCGNGFVAEKDGMRSPISGKKAQYFTHALRHQYDGILVGKKTIVTDNPELTTRFHQNPRNPLRIFFDGNHEISPLAKVFADDHFLKISKENCPKIHGSFDLDFLGKMLFDRGIRSVLVEGGPKTIASFLQKNLLDEMVLIVSKTIFFEKGVPAFPHFPENWKEKYREDLGQDTIIVFQKQGE